MATINTMLQAGKVLVDDFLVMRKAEQEALSVFAEAHKVVGGIMVIGATGEAICTAVKALDMVDKLGVTEKIKSKGDNLAQKLKSKVQDVNSDSEVTEQ